MRVCSRGQRVRRQFESNTSSLGKSAFADAEHVFCNGRSGMLPTSTALNAVARRSFDNWCGKCAYDDLFDGAVVAATECPKNGAAHRGAAQRGAAQRVSERINRLPWHIGWRSSRSRVLRYMSVVRRRLLK